MKLPSVGDIPHKRWAVAGLALGIGLTLAAVLAASAIASKDQELERRQQRIEQRDQLIKERDQQLDTKNGDLKGKQDQIDELNRQLQAKAERSRLAALLIPTVQARPAATGDIWWVLGDCESGNDPAKNTGNGYYGAFQFSIGTWNSMGTGYDRADHAPYGVQLDAAKRLQARSGWGQWPGCAAKLGLR